MKKIFVIGLIIGIILSVGFIIYFNINGKKETNFNNNAIKKGDIWVDVKFRTEIPKIDSKKEAGVGIEDSSTNTSYYINYNQIVSNRPLILVSVTKINESGEKEYSSYAYSWKELEADENNLFIPKGWSMHSKNNVYGNEFHPISGCPIESINGKVAFTKGDTSLIKNMFDL